MYNTADLDPQIASKHPVQCAYSLQSGGYIETQTHRFVDKQQK